VCIALHETVRALETHNANPSENLRSIVNQWATESPLWANAPADSKWWREPCDGSGARPTERRSFGALYGDGNSTDLSHFPRSVPEWTADRGFTRARPVTHCRPR
jgi:hypothetical protein